MTDDTKDPKPTDAHAETGAPDDVREQMRLALERKQGKSSGGSAHLGGGGKASSATANSKRQREFRRKSGG